MDGNLLIDGDIEGQIQVCGTLRIGKSGYIKGTVQAEKIIISGKLQGEVQAPYMEITDTGDFDGKAEIVELVIAKGGRFSGTSERGELAQITALVDKKNSVQGIAKAEKAIALESNLSSKNTKTNRGA